MAEADVVEFLTCPLCEYAFKEPVSLGCHHNFCCRCLKKYWDQNETMNCPVCTRKSSKELVHVNFALKQQSISFRQKQEGAVQKTDPATEKPDELKEWIESEHHLTQQRENLSAVEKLYNEIILHTEKQAVQCKAHIRALFTRLHKFLQQEETWALEVLREEMQRQAQTMSSELGKIRQELASVETTIQELKELLHTDTKTLLQTYKTQAKAYSSQPEPQPPTGLLLDQAKVLGNLGYRVWTSMRREVSHTPVILDPNTAARILYLSEDLSRVRHGNTKQHQIPLNQERFTKYPTVLGSEGFTSGVHHWDVEVGDHPEWSIGVAKESVKRKGEVCVSPQYGFWCLWHGEGEYINSFGKSVPVEKHPEKIQVKLDCDKGEVSFYDSDHMTHLYTHKYGLKDKLFPYFSIGEAGEAKTKEIKICPTGGSL